MEERTKSKCMTDHEEFLATLSPEDRILHIAAGAMALYSQFEGIRETMMAIINNGGSLPGDAQVAVPVTIACGVAEVMGEMLSLLESKGIIDNEEVKAFIDKKRAEIESKMEAEGTAPPAEPQTPEQVEEDIADCMTTALFRTGEPEPTESSYRHPLGRVFH